MKPNTLLSEYANTQELADKTDQEIFVMQSAQRYKTIRNNFAFVQILNIVCLCGNTFAMAFYRWYLIQDDEEININQSKIWLNLLYLYDTGNEENHYMTFGEYLQSDQNICIEILEPDPQAECFHQFHTLQIVGICCFCFILVSQAFLIYDILRLKLVLEALQTQKKAKGVLKGSWVYSIIIGAQGASLLTYLITVALINKDRTPSRFGPSYFVSWFCCAALIIFAIYYRWSKARYNRFLMMEKLVGSKLTRESLGVNQLELQNQEQESINLI